MQFGSALIVLIAPVIALVARRVRLAAALAIAGVGAYSVSKVAKDLFMRPRPVYFLDVVHIRPGSTTTGSGYPSGHSSVAFALATVLCLWVGPRLRPAKTAALLVIAALVAFGRVYVGAHLPLDVIGGAALGTLIGALAVTAIRSAETLGTAKRR